MQVTSVQATDVSLAILRRLHPGKKDIPADVAMADVRIVLDLETALRSAASECEPGDWRAIATVLTRNLRGAAR